MSTKRKGKGGGIDIFDFVKREGIPSEVVDHFSLSLRLYRNAIASKQGTVEMWHDIAGMLNVGGRFATERNRQDWIDELNLGAEALKSINAKRDRVGGPMVANRKEAKHIGWALSCLEYQVWPSMTMQDFIRIAKQLDEDNKHLEDMPP